MGPFLSRFSIRDLEEFSGVKAHTIRVWERRYGLLDPARTTTNIRTYSVEELKTILNVAFLNRHGVKISRIARLPSVERDRQVKEIAERETDPADALNTLKLAMVTYDADLFDRTSAIYRNREGFQALVMKLYLPLLEHVGLLWQTNSICPAQEHFVSNLVRQKLVAAIDCSVPVTMGSGAQHILYLPEEEIHELGLLYVHYLLRTAGENVLYLGQSVPSEDLPQVVAQFAGEIRFISMITAFPRTDDLPSYLIKLRTLIPDARCTFLFCGARAAASIGVDVPNGMRLLPHFKDLLATLA